MEDESFDVASTAPVYLSRKEAGEWMVPMDEENGQPVEIMEDDEDEEDNEKFSDVSPSVMSTSTVAESREFWLNCLKENGVDMTTQLPHGSPRKSLSFYAPKGPEASPRTDPLRIHNHNAMQHEGEPTSDILKQQPAAFRNVEASVNESNASVSSEDESIKHVDSQPSVDSSVAEPPDQTMDKTEMSLDWNKWSFTDGIPFEDMLQRQELLEFESEHQHDEENDLLESDKFYGDSVNYFRLANVAHAVPAESNESKKNDLADGDNDTVKDNTAAGASFEVNWPGDSPKESVAKKSSPVKVTTVTSEETESTQFSEEESSSYIPKRSTVQVVTVSTNDTFDTSIAESDVPDQNCPGESEPQSQGLEDLLSASLDHSLFVDESQDTTSTKGRWPPKRETQEEQKQSAQIEEPKEQKHPAKVEEPKSPPSNPLPGDSIDSEKTLPKAAPQVLKQTHSVTMLESAKPNTISKDPNDWMYLVWYRKGLMNQVPSNCIGQGDATLQIRTSFPARKKSNTASTLTTPTATSGAADPQTEKTKNGNRNDSEPLVTPREAMRTLDYKAVQADEENLTRRARRSLPVNMRFRKHHENVAKQKRRPFQWHVLSRTIYGARKSRTSTKSAQSQTHPTFSASLYRWENCCASKRRKSEYSKTRTIW